MKKVFWPFIVCVALSMGILLGGFIVSSSSRSNTPTNMSNSNKVKLNKLLDLIEREYVDDINTDSIIDNTVTTILEQLDPHSVYIAKNELQYISESMRGNFVGVGINYYVFNDTISIIKTIPKGPSFKSGLLPGDRILFADERKLFGEKLPNDSIVSILRGEEGTKVKLSVYRKKDNEEFDVKVVRSLVPLKSIDVGIKLEDGMGYIKMNRFSESTHREFVEQLKKLEYEGISGLILDLRGNGGGYMEQAIEIVDEFLDYNQIIVKTVNKRGNTRTSVSTSRGLYKKGELYILIDETSASASEIVAGAIQDNDRGTIVGRRSFGKGLVQRELLLGDGSAIRLTTARYYTPSGRSIQKPYNNGIKEHNNGFFSRYEKGEIYATDSIKVADSLQFKTKKGRIVYGGGGIVPDLYVSTDLKHGEDAIMLLMNSAKTTYFVFEQIDNNRKVFDTYDLNQINDRVLDQGIIYNKFKKALKESGLEFNLDKRKKTIEYYLVAEFINQLLGEEAYYHWILKEDPMIKRINQE